MREPDSFIGFEIAKTEDIVKLSQKEYIKIYLLNLEWAMLSQ